MYRVILVSNGEYRGTLYKSKTRESCFLNYHRIKDENEGIMFPQRFVNTGKIKPVTHQICVIKPTEEGDTFRILRDDYGKLYTEEPIGDWTILHSSPYEIEETFWIFGHDPKAGRPTIREVAKKLFVGAHKKNMVKQVLVVHNKLVIYHEDQFDMIVCKCMADAQRLHHTLAKITKKQKIKCLLFMGTASPATVSHMYGVIKEKTGWPIEKIRRTSTRP